MKIERLVIGMLFITAIVGGMYSIIGELGDQYNVEVNQDEITAPYKNSQDMIESINQSYSKLTEGGMNPTDFVTGLVLVLKVIKFIVITPFNVANTMMIYTISTLGLPTWFATFITGGLVVLVVFALVALIMRYRV